MANKKDHKIESVNAYVKTKPVVVRIVMQDKEEPESWSPAPPEYLVEDMQKWCKENNCGKRTSYDMFEFPTKEAAMMFRLRWS